VPENGLYVIYASYDQAAIRSAREGRDSTLNLAGVADAHRTYLHSERCRRSLGRAPLADSRGYRGITNDCDLRHGRSDLLEELERLPADAVFEHEEPAGVAIRSGEAVDKAGANWIGDDHDTIGTSRVACCNGPTVELLWARMTSNDSC